MKRIIVIILLLSSTLFAQENPWEKKSKENPWKTETTEEKEEEKEVAVVEKDTTVQVETMDTIVRQDLSVNEQKQLIRKAETESRANYKSGGDFAFGFATGLVFNYVGMLPAAIYIAPTTKKEKRATEPVNNDSTYVNIEPEVLNKKTKSAVKSKKALATLGGNLVGSLAQIGILIGVFAFY